MIALLCTLLEDVTSAFDPAVLMSAFGVAVRPVDHAALVIEFILAIDKDNVPDCEWRDTACQIDVVRNQNRLSGFKFNQKPLVAAAFVVVVQDTADRPLRHDLLAVICGVKCRMRSRYAAFDG